MPTDLENYFFDLRGYVLLKGAVNPADIALLNAEIDAIPPLEPDAWHGHIQRGRYPQVIGTVYQQIYEAGPAFESLIDHPAWLHHVIEWVGKCDGLFIDENFAQVRGPGGGQKIHGGGHTGQIRRQYRYLNNQFHCGQVNMLLALTDIGPDDGPTMLVPGSHKSNLMHPALEEREKLGDSLEALDGAVTIQMEAGDALLFVDALLHGSALRRSEGQRRIVVYRYGPNWGHTRYGYEPSAQLLARLTPRRKMIVRPIAPRLPN